VSRNSASFCVASAGVHVRLGKRKVAQYDYSPLVRLLVLTGMRVSEALALRWIDIDLLNAEITFGTRGVAAATSMTRRRKQASARYPWHRDSSTCS
jgi:integrase